MQVSKPVKLGPVLTIAGIVSALALNVMMLVTVIDVGMANLLHQPIVGAFDLVSTTLVFAIFAGVPITFKREANITVDVIDHFVSAGSVDKLRHLSRLLSLAFLLILLYNMIDPALDAYKYGEKKQELGLPLYWIWLPILVGISMAVVSVLGSLLQKKHPEAHEEK